MKFKFAHNNLNVLDLDKSIRFYEEALDLKVTRKIGIILMTLVIMNSIWPS